MARSLVLDGEHLETTAEVVFPTISLGVPESQAGFVWQAMLPAGGLSGRLLGTRQISRALRRDACETRSPKKPPRRQRCEAEVRSTIVAPPGVSALQT